MSNMDSSWETLFKSWAQPPSNTEQTHCDNAVKAIRNAISKSDDLKFRDTFVFTQGSYRNRVNVRQDSDVDVGVLLQGIYFYDLVGGRTEDAPGIDTEYSFSTFKSDLGKALTNHFGFEAVTRGNKAFNVKETSYHVEADVVPLYELREYGPYGETRRGVSLFPDNGHRIDNYPERLKDDWPQIPLHYENGVSKNTDTHRRFKSVVRIIKKLRNLMDDQGHEAAKAIPSYLIECMVWNISNSHFDDSTWIGMVRRVFAILWVATAEDSKCNQFTEVDAVKFLFRANQPWTRTQAHTFINSAWTYIGIK